MLSKWNLHSCHLMNACNKQCQQFSVGFLPKGPRYHPCGPWWPQRTRTRKIHQRAFRHLGSQGGAERCSPCQHGECRVCQQTWISERRGPSTGFCVDKSLSWLLPSPKKNWDREQKNPCGGGDHTMICRFTSQHCIWEESKCREHQAGSFHLKV